jgi:hypothetical protein
MKKIYIKEKCRECGQTVSRKATCSDCVFLVYYMCADRHFCEKDKAGTRLCKHFELKPSIK